MKINPKAVCVLISVLWVSVTGGLWAQNAYDLSHGREIRLKVVPVDPRELFRGDYVILDYDLSLIDIKKVPSEIRYEKTGTRAFVEILEKDGEWQAAGVFKKPPKGKFFLQGKTDYATENQLRLRYGIESYFVPEGEGKAYEEARNRKHLWAVVSVTRHGSAKLKHLEIKPS